MVNPQSITTLNPWELAVMQGYLSGHYGWKSEVARRFGKSRAAPSVVIKKLQIILGESMPRKMGAKNKTEMEKAFEKKKAADDYFNTVSQAWNEMLAMTSTGEKETLIELSKKIVEFGNLTRCDIFDDIQKLNELLTLIDK